MQVKYLENKNLKEYLDELVEIFEQPDFIEDDPIQIPHRFSQRQDIEIMAFWTATLAWGQRKSIIKSAENLLQLMDNSPHDFVKNHAETDRKTFEKFYHRTFQPTDSLYFLDFLQRFYQQNTSLEAAFLPKNASDTGGGHISMKMRLTHFHEQFFDAEFAPDRTRKHVATPTRGSACKRLCMFLRWMVRPNVTGVDFGIWEQISTADLMMPLDVHVEREARKLGLLQREKPDWQAVEELTENLRQFNAQDPTRYDFALFGLGVLQKKATKVI